NIQTGAVETPYAAGIDLNGDLNAFNDRPGISNPNAPRNTVAIQNSLLGIDGPGFSDADGNPINPANTYYVVLPSAQLKGAIAGRNTLRAERTNIMDFSLTKAFKMPWEGHKLEVRLEFFNVFNHSNFTWNVGDVSDGDVTNPKFNNVRL